MISTLNQLTLTPAPSPDLDQLLTSAAAANPPSACRCCSCVEDPDEPCPEHGMNRVGRGYLDQAPNVVEWSSLNMVKAIDLFDDFLAQQRVRRHLREATAFGNGEVVGLQEMFQAFFAERWAAEGGL